MKQKQVNSQNISIMRSFYHSEKRKHKNAQNGAP